VSPSKNSDMRFTFFSFQNSKFKLLIYNWCQQENSSFLHVPDKENVRGKAAMDEKQEFTFVNDCFEDKPNAAIGVFLQALINSKNEICLRNYLKSAKPYHILLDR
ncbi:MAG: hypothetical protein ACOCW7_02175, partial [Bacteroidota bacterium]